MAKQSKRVGFYVRVSTDGQTTENQRRELREVAAARGWEVTRVYHDNGISGAKGREHRKQLDAMLKDAARGKFDMVAAWSVDRIGRSLKDLVAFLSELRALKVDLYLHKQALDTSTPSGRAMFGMLGIFAEFEREIIVERVNAGLARAKAEQASGKPRKHKDGRIKKAIGRPRVSPETEAAIRAMRSEGKGMTAISKALGVGGGTVTRVLGTDHTRQRATLTV